MKIYKSDILIVGGGFAGKLCAILFYLKYKDEFNIKIITKSNESNSQLAQGGIAISIDIDDIESHINDTILTSCNLADKNVVEHIIRNSFKCIDILNRLDFDFEKDINNEYKKRKEGGHSKRRVYYNSDFTGKEIMNSIDTFIKNCNSIEIIENYSILELDKYDNKCTGGYFYNEMEKKVIYIKSNITILASGGVGGLFKNNSGYNVNIGEGIVAAKNIDAKVSNLRFIQFHPTAYFNSSNNQTLLITEAIRGEGASLINSKKERFLEKYNITELSPRDSVSRAIHSEINIHKESIFLDCSSIIGLDIKFKNIYNYFINIGIDMKKDLIPIVPVPHYLCGGIDIDLNGETNIKNLFALGECSNVGLHGANRLASNSLLEVLIISNNLVENIKIKSIKIANPVKEFVFGYDTYQSQITIIQQLFQNNFKIVNNFEDLLNTLNELIEIEQNKLLNYNPLDVYKVVFNNYYNIVKLIIDDSVKNSTSIGCFFINN